MKNGELVEYIKTRRAMGLSDEVIKQNLLIAGGWTLDDIKEAMPDSLPKEDGAKARVRKVVSIIFGGLVICITLAYIGIFVSSNMSIISQKSEERNALNAKLTQEAETEKLAKKFRYPIFGQVVTRDESGKEIERVEKVYERDSFIKDLQVRGFAWFYVNDPHDYLSFFDEGSTVSTYVLEDKKEGDLHFTFDQEFIATTTLDKVLTNTSPTQPTFMTNWWVTSCTKEGYTCTSQKFKANGIEWVVFLYESPSSGSFALGIKNNLALVVQSGTKAFYKGSEAFIDLVKSIY